jgi:hypothetical protein
MKEIDNMRLEEYLAGQLSSGKAIPLKVGDQKWLT